MSARGRKTRLIGSSSVVVRRPVLEQAAGGLLAGRHQVGAQAPVGQRRGGLLADGGDLQAGERTGVQAVLLELLAHRADGVDRGERDPLVAALDQAAHGLVHLLRVARRLDRDRRHLLGHRAVAAQPRGQRRRPAPWCAAPARASRTAAWSRTRTASRAGRRPRRRRSRPARSSGAARASAPISPRVETIVSWVVRVPVRVIETGVSAQRPAAISSAAISPMRAHGREQHQRRVGGVGRPVDVGVAAGHDGDLAVVLGGQRDAGVRRDGGDRGDAGDDLEADARPWCTPGPPRARRRRGTGRRPSAGRRACRSWPA